MVDLFFSVRFPPFRKKKKCLQLKMYIFYENKLVIRAYALCNEGNTLKKMMENVSIISSLDGAGAFLT